MKKILAVSVVLLAMGSALFAGELRLSRHYTSDMVLQREKPVLIRGFAEKGSEVTITFSGQTKETKTNEKGEWSVTLDPMSASAEGRELTCRIPATGEKVVLENVVVGDVFVFARQRTIDVSLGRDEAGKKAASDVASVRVIKIKTVPAYDLQPDLAKEATSGWTPLSKEAALSMDAAAFYMARDLAGTADVPVGIIDINLGRHFPIGWMSREALLETGKVFPGKGNRVNGMIEMMDNYANPDEQQKYKDSQRLYPRPPAKEDARFPAAGYNAVLHPLRGLAVRALLLQLGNNYTYYPYAVLEREGEHTNRRFAAQAFDDCYLVRKWCLYLAPTTTPRLPNEWRDVFGDATLPIGWITPPGSDLDTLGRHHREMRELQRQAAEKEEGVDLILPGTENIDLSAQPADDELLGSRCLAWLEGAVYKPDEAAPTGPLFERVELKGSTAQVFFKKGTAKGLKADEDALDYFEVAAATVSENPNIATNGNLIYTPAKATIDGKTIRLSSDTVQEIAYVRYNWREKPDQGLTAANGLPAFPFSTDGTPFPERIDTSGEEKLPPEFFMSIADWDNEGPVIYDGNLRTSLDDGDAMGPTGILATIAYRQNLFVNNTYAGSPAEGKLFHGDFIYGVNGKPFGKNVKADLAEAIVLAETEEANGILSLNVLRDEKKTTVDIQLEVLGSYSETSPYNCPKTNRIVAEAEARLARAGGPKGGGGRMGHPVFSNAEAMFLLAAGTPEYQGLVRRHVYKRIATTDLSKPIDPNGRDSQGGPWDLSADMLLIAEYYLATGDRNVLPYLKHKCDSLTSIQIRHPDEEGPWPEVQNIGQMGGWRHNFYGRATYGTMPAVGVPAVLGYHLAKEAGVEYNPVGYERAVHWFHHNGAQIGSIVYGYFKEPRTSRKPIDPDKLAAGKLDPGNGGVAGAAILYDLRGNEEIAKINSYFATHSYNNTYYAHGGHFWANLYTPLGAKVDGRESFQFFMKGYRDYATIKRMPDYSREQGYSHYLADVAPRERLRILGAHESVFSANPPEALQAALEAYYKRDYGACEKAVSALLATGRLKGLDLKKAEQLRDAAVLIQESIALDLARLHRLISEKKPYEAGLDLTQLKAVMPESSAELAAIEAALAQPEMEKLVRDDKRRLKAYQESLALKLSADKKEEGSPGWLEIVSQSQGRYAIRSENPTPSIWRMKVVESAQQAPEGWTGPGFDDSDWSEVTLPINWRENHTILLRTPFDIEDPAAVKALRFNQFAKHLSHMKVFINGRAVAKISAVSGGREVGIPLNDHALKLLKKGRNTLSATYKNHLRWGGRGRPDGGGLNITLEMQEK
ncbi:DUF6288 domain-containing protein [Coraliomargarita sinensis]|nr:DUF6288 domain-containing protein [Coraliomargarita sinensis]